MGHIQIKLQFKRKAFKKQYNDRERGGGGSRGSNKTKNKEKLAKLNKIEAQSDSEETDEILLRVGEKIEESRREVCRTNFQQINQLTVTVIQFKATEKPLVTW